MSQEETIIAVNGFAILTILLSFIVPESLEESARSEFQLGDINPFKQVAVLRAPPLCPASAALILCERLSMRESVGSSDGDVPADCGHHGTDDPLHGRDDADERSLLPRLP